MRLRLDPPIKRNKFCLYLFSRHLWNFEYRSAQSAIIHARTYRCGSTLRAHLPVRYFVPCDFFGGFARESIIHEAKASLLVSSGGGGYMPLRGIARGRVSRKTYESDRAVNAPVRFTTASSPARNPPLPSPYPPPTPPASRSEQNFLFAGEYYS